GRAGHLLPLPHRLGERGVLAVAAHVLRTEERAGAELLLTGATRAHGVVDGVLGLVPPELGHVEARGGEAVEERRRLTFQLGAGDLAVRQRGELLLGRPEVLGDLDPRGCGLGTELTLQLAGEVHPIGLRAPSSGDVVPGAAADADQHQQRDADRCHPRVAVGQQKSHTLSSMQGWVRPGPTWPPSFHFPLNHVLFLKSRCTTTLSPAIPILQPEWTSPNPSTNPPPGAVPSQPPAKL